MYSAIIMVDVSDNLDFSDLFKFEPLLIVPQIIFFIRISDQLEFNIWTKNGIVLMIIF